MKQAFLLVLGMMVCHLYAQNVGIGTKDPKNKLHVAGGLRVDSLAAKKDSGLILHNDNGDVYSLSLTGKKSDLLRGDGSFAAAAAPTDAWLLGGNAGTDSVTNFFGTTDNKPVMFRINDGHFGTISRYNIALGDEAMGYYLATGQGGILGANNVAIGNHAMNRAAGYNNVGIGRLALALPDGSYNTAVGSNALHGGIDASNGFPGFTSENVAVGHNALANIYNGTSNVAVGVGALQGLGPSSAYYMSSTGNTAIGYEALHKFKPYEGPQDSYNTALGYRALYENINGAGNTAVGFSALASNDAFFGTAVGYRALSSNTSGFGNVSIGYASLGKNTTGNNNTATGLMALTGNTTGNNNTAYGDVSLQTNSTGLDNTAVGHAALHLSTTANYNTANGSQSLFATTTGGYNSAHGFKAMYSNTTGINNTASGFKALNFNTTGNQNSGFGFEALNTNTTGSNNTAIGYRADVTSGALTNATAVGYMAKVNASNKVRIGNAAVTVIEGQVPFTTPSDGRFKYNVKEDVGGLAFIMKLRPVTYQFDVKKFDHISQVSFAADKSDGYNEAEKIRRTGFIAQEVEEAAAETHYNFSGIVKPQNEKEHYSLSYESFVVPLVKAVQDQQKIIERQQKQIDELVKKIELLENKN